MVYNLNGLELSSYPIHDVGEGFIEINGSNFKAGMYLYSLLIDETLVDTKKMVLTN